MLQNKFLIFIALRITAGSTETNTFFTLRSTSRRQFFSNIIARVLSLVHICNIFEGFLPCFSFILHSCSYYSAFSVLIIFLTPTGSYCVAHHRILFPLGPRQRDVTFPANLPRKRCRCHVFIGLSGNEVMSILKCPSWHKETGYGCFE